MTAPEHPPFELVLRKSYRRLLVRGIFLFATLLALSISLTLISDQTREGTERTLIQLRDGLVSLRERLVAADAGTVDSLLGSLRNQGVPIRLIPIRSESNDPLQDPFSGFGGDFSFLLDVPVEHLQWIEDGQRYAVSPRRRLGEVPWHWSETLSKAPPEGTIVPEPEGSPLYSLPSTRGGLHTLIVPVEPGRGIALVMPERPWTDGSFLRLGFAIFLLVAVLGLLFFGSPVLLLGFFQARREARMLASPIRSIAKAFSDLGAGKAVSVPVSTLSAREISDLAMSLGEISARLAGTMRDLAGSRDQIKRNLDEQSRMLMNISHDLRTPLTAITGYAEVLSRQHPESQAAKVISTECASIVRLVDDLFELAQIENAGIRLHPSRFSLVDLLNQVRDAFKASAWQNGVLVCIGSLPQIDATTVFADPQRVRQILDNLVANAVRHTPSGGFVELSAEPRGDDAVEIHVTDSGDGIDHEHLERIFDRLYRVDPSRSSTANRQRHAGLGLSIARGLARGMGGELTVRSRAGEGACFTLSLPIEPLRNNLDTVLQPNGHEER